MGAVVADTHALIWYLFEPQQLSDKARIALREAEANPGIIYVPTIAIVEVRYLVEKGTITEDVFQKMLNSLLDPSTALTAVPLDLEISRALERVPKVKVPDMPDRIIAATALHLSLPLITRDRKIQASNVQTIW
ncbi:MAG TPA: type II toxin-antitoxin system VapC family toxin [Pyrinomonadaceae bacterium]|nr:type II toxin-antitoxin system VapC family toxin [Pyrinomonadaceae bacterium]